MSDPDMTCLDLHASDWFTITGRGRVASVDMRQVPGCQRMTSPGDIPVAVGDRVRIDGGDYEIRGIEYSTALIYPPYIKPDVGLLVREWRS